MKSIIGGLLIGAGVAVAGDLPQLDKKPWVGWFGGTENRNFRFGVKMDGEAILMPKLKKEISSRIYWINVDPIIQEVLPDGKVVNKQARDGGWEAITEGGSDVEVLTYRGTVTGGAKFEVTFEMKGNEISGGGRVLEKGELTEHPIRFAIRIKIPNAYASESNEDKLYKAVRRDRYEFVLGGGEEQKLHGLESLDPKVAVAPGVRSLHAEISKYDGAEIDLDAGELGLLRIIGGKGSPLYKGFYAEWSPLPEKDSEGKGRFIMEFK